MAANHNADDAREPAASASPPANEAEHRALLRPSSFISAISNNNERCGERAFEPSEKVIVSVSADPKGNIEGDLQAGATTGGTLLWVLLWATAMGLLVQLHAARLGVATGRHLAELCRDEYPDWARRALWLMAEVALVSADIQEVIGSAIAIKILSHGLLPLWAGVVITTLDCFMFLSLENYGVRKLEALFAVLITTMACSFAWMFVETDPSGKDLFMGILVPKLSSRSIKQAVGLVGGVITPHNVFLHSALVQSRKIDPDKEYEVREALRLQPGQLLPCRS